MVDKIKGGWLEFDAVIATPDMMRLVGGLGKVLGPRGLMPNPKTGTVTFDVKTAVKETKAGKVAVGGFEQPYTYSTPLAGNRFLAIVQLQTFARVRR